MPSIELVGLESWYDKSRLRCPTRNHTRSVSIVVGDQRKSQETTRARKTQAGGRLDVGRQRHGSTNTPQIRSKLIDCAMGYNNPLERVEARSCAGNHIDKWHKVASQIRFWHLLSCSIRRRKASSSRLRSQAQRIWPTKKSMIRVSFLWAHQVKLFWLYDDSQKILWKISKNQNPTVRDEPRT